MSVPIVICPCGELVDLLSVRHFTTMDVDDMDTCRCKHYMSPSFRQQEVLGLPKGRALMGWCKPLLSADSLMVQRLVGICSSPVHPQRSPHVQRRR
jgi:hypothetical protein